MNSSSKSFISIFNSVIYLLTAFPHRFDYKFTNQYITVAAVVVQEDSFLCQYAKIGVEFTHCLVGLLIQRNKNFDFCFTENIF